MSSDRILLGRKLTESSLVDDRLVSSIKSIRSQDSWGTRRQCANCPREVELVRIVAKFRAQTLDRAADASAPSTINVVASSLSFEFIELLGIRP